MKYLGGNQSMSFTLQIQSVLFKNEKSALLRTLENLQNAFRVDAEGAKFVEKAVLIWGDASPEPLFTAQDIEELNKQFDRFTIQYEYFNENTGTAKGHNKMAKMQDCECIMIMNPDIVVNPRIFAQLLQPFSDPTVGMTEARQTPIEHHKEYDKETGETSWASTACTIIPREVYEKVGGFDEATFFMYCDDLDFSWMVRLAGYKIIYVPAAVVFHDKRISANAQWQPTQAERYYSAEAAILMAYKWSNNERVEKLLKQFEDSKGDIELKVVESFYKRKEESRLPVQLDADHKIAEFVGDDYGYSRFKMG